MLLWIYINFTIMSPLSQSQWSHSTEAETSTPILTTPEEPTVKIIDISSADSNFEWKTLIRVQDGEAVIGYALELDSNGRIWWNRITYEKWTETIWATYQLHEQDIQELHASGIMKAFFEYSEKLAREKMDSVQVELMRLFIIWDQYNPFSGTYPNNIDYKELFNTVSTLPQIDQEKLAQEFYSKTIGIYIWNNRNAYSVYWLLKWTVFALEFARLENERLQMAGYSPLQ